MESVPLVPRAKFLPNLDALPLIRELFQEEFSSFLHQAPSKKLSQRLLNNLNFEKSDERIPFPNVKEVDSQIDRKDNLIIFSEKILEVSINVLYKALSAEILSSKSTGRSNSFLKIDKLPPSPLHSLNFFFLAVMLLFSLHRLTMSTKKNWII